MANPAPGPETGPTTDAPAPNQDGYLSADELADKLRFQFKEEDVELPEIGGKIRVKQLNLEEREGLPDLVDEKGKVLPDPGLRRLASMFAAIVIEPDMQMEAARQAILKWPAEAVDRVIIAFGKMTGTKEEAAAVRDEFRGS